uniref:Uncharacterized protein n=1 Tax=Mycena chlorophos TaxID=658473 RepID=A0ABQ0LCE9_MYCCL|nr:predicted protein [Mycena chlorophos]
MHNSLTLCHHRAQHALPGWDLWCPSDSRPDGPGRLPQSTNSRQTLQRRPCFPLRRRSQSLDFPSAARHECLTRAWLGLGEQENLAANDQGSKKQWPWPDAQPRKLTEECAGTPWFIAPTSSSHVPTSSSREDTIFMALCARGDYGSDISTGDCGPETAVALVQRGFAHALCQAVDAEPTKRNVSLRASHALRDNIHEELRTNSKRHLRRKESTRFNNILETFPNIPTITFSSESVPQPAWTRARRFSIGLVLHAAPGVGRP